MSNPTDLSQAQLFQVDLLQISDEPATQMRVIPEDKKLLLIRRLSVTVWDYTNPASLVEGIEVPLGDGATGLLLSTCAQDTRQVFRLDQCVVQPGVDALGQPIQRAFFRAGTFYSGAQTKGGRVIVALELAADYQSGAFSPWVFDPLESTCPVVDATSVAENASHDLTLYHDAAASRWYLISVGGIQHGVRIFDVTNFSSSGFLPHAMKTTWGVAGVLADLQAVEVVDVNFPILAILGRHNFLAVKFDDMTNDEFDGELFGAGPPGDTLLMKEGAASAPQFKLWSNNGTEADHRFKIVDVGKLLLRDPAAQTERYYAPGDSDTSAYIPEYDSVYCTNFNGLVRYDVALPPTAEPVMGSYLPALDDTVNPPGLVPIEHMIAARYDVPGDPYEWGLFGNTATGAFQHWGVNVQTKDPEVVDFVDGKDAVPSPWPSWPLADQKYGQDVEVAPNLHSGHPMVAMDSYDVAADDWRIGIYDFVDKAQRGVLQRALRLPSRERRPARTAAGAAGLRVAVPRDVRDRAAVRVGMTAGGWVGSRAGDAAGKFLRVGCEVREPRTENLPGHAPTRPRPRKKMTLPIQTRHLPPPPPPQHRMPMAQRTFEAPKQPVPMPKPPAEPVRDDAGLERMHDALAQRLANLRAAHAANDAARPDEPSGNERIVHHRHLNARLANAARTRPDDVPVEPETPPVQGGMPTDVREVPAADPGVDGGDDQGVHPRRLIGQLGREIRETLRDLRGQMAEEGDSELGGDIRGLARDFRDSLRDIRHRMGEGELDRMGVLGEVASAMQSLADGLGGLLAGDEEPAPTGDPRNGPTAFLFDGDVSATPAGVSTTPEEPPTVDEPPAGPTRFVFDGSVSATPAGVPPTVDEPAGPTRFVFDGSVAATPAGVPSVGGDDSSPSAQTAPTTTDAPNHVDEPPVAQPNLRRLLQDVLPRLRDAFEAFRSGLKPSNAPGAEPGDAGPEIRPAGDPRADDVRSHGGMQLADRLAAARLAFSGLGEPHEPGRRFERVG